MHFSPVWINVFWWNQRHNIPTGLDNPFLIGFSAVMVNLDRWVGFYTGQIWLENKIWDSTIVAVHGNARKCGCYCIKQNHWGKEKTIIYFPANFCSCIFKTSWDRALGSSELWENFDDFGKSLNSLPQTRGELTPSRTAGGRVIHCATWSPILT